MKKQTILLVIAIGFGLAACNEKPVAKPGYSDAETSSEKIEAAKAKVKKEAEEKTAKENEAKIQAGISAALKKRDEDAQQKPGTPIKEEPKVGETPVIPAPIVDVPAKKEEPAAPKAEEPKKEEPKKEEAQKPAIKPNEPVAVTPKIDDEETPVVSTGGEEDEAPVIEQGEVAKPEPKEEVKKEEKKAAAAIVNPKAQLVSIKLGAGNTASSVQIDCTDKVPGAAMLNKGIVLLPGSRAILATANEKNEDAAKDASCLEDKAIDLKKDLEKTTHQILAIGETKKVAALMQTKKDGKIVAAPMEVEVTCAKDQASASTLRGVTLLAGSSLSLDAIIKEEKGDRNGTVILGCK